jgi:hypothetical protein
MSEPRRWWGQRWNAVLDAAGPAHARRVQRGQALARRGLVDDLEIVPGRITASVPEDRISPFAVELRWAVPDEVAWEAATEALSREVRFTAALLDGELPEGLDEVLEGAGVRLLPTPDDLDQRCSCPERTPWCRHVAAVHTAAGARFDRDPSQLLLLRGRRRDDLLRAVRAERQPDTGPPTVELDLSAGLTGARGDLDAITLHPAPVDDPAALLLHLGDPPGVDDVEPLLRLVERAAAGAWRLAAGDGADAADEELLLAELRAQRMASAAALAEALGRDAADVTTQLDGLFETGQVLRTGSGDRARYRVAAT